MLETIGRREVLAPAAHTSAVVWINRLEATVATSRPHGGVDIGLVRATATESLLSYLARVVDLMGERQRVLIIGPGSARTALEREYVATFGRPARLVDVEPADARAREHIVEELLTLAR